ncbi:MAG: hypothetical protein U1E96_02590 [Azonexus sp.]
MSTTPSPGALPGPWPRPDRRHHRRRPGIHGKNSATAAFTPRVAADNAANAPKILAPPTPSTGHSRSDRVVATVRADAWSGIAQVAVEMRQGQGAWQPATLDAAGRLKLVPTNPASSS